ncbi:NADPH-dependent oxidoreductase [Agromyces intestinalis]|uniref:NADPH-dependent oxidoreductase n=1 Tax=Agromyces intestinalis TaxID=2592652 RepID=A0A5C1YIP5_9MICO|nr:NAD(P)H-dependent oxidoreductase [Agromyces intestinalis]QEO14927.1 NADPH-dependent oxidoreductase [Agromyces intestinalis]
MPSLVVLSGNPRTPSKTSAAAVDLAERIADASGLAAIAEPVVVELAELGGAVLDPSDPRTVAARATVAAASVLVVATPAYKGSYTGLLKAFLDGYGPSSLEGVAAIPFVVAGSPAHTTLVADIHLRPLLHEVGAETPFGRLAMLESEVADAIARGERFGAWVDARRRLIAATLAEGVIA